jgi:hypothetical protein
VVEVRTPSTTTSISSIPKPGDFTAAKLSKARHDIAVGAAGNKIVFAGGWYWDINFSVLYSNAVDIYDNTTRLWTKTTLSQKRDAVSVAVAGSKILFAGGFITTGTGISKDVDIYDVSTDTWTTSSMSVPRYTAIGERCREQGLLCGERQ